MAIESWIQTKERMQTKAKEDEPALEERKKKRRRRKGRLEVFFKRWEVSPSLCILACQGSNEITGSAANQEMC
jgi:hypothetical protein